MSTLGKRIAAFRKEKGLTQEALAEITDVTPQAVSKWENDQTCPDIQLLPKLSEILGVSVDTLLSGKRESLPAVTLVPEENRKSISDMMMRIEMLSDKGDSLRINLPMALIQTAVEMGLELPKFSGMKLSDKIDFRHLFELVSHGAIGNLVEMESAEGETLRIYVG